MSDACTIKNTNVLIMMSVVIAVVSCTLDVAITILDCMQLQAHMNASNSSNNCSYMATALCTLAETVEARYVHIRLSDSIHQGIIKGTNVT